MANHRAPRRSASRTGTTDGMDLPAAPTAPAPVTTPADPATVNAPADPAPVNAPAVPVAGKRKAVKPSRAARSRARRTRTPAAPPAPVAARTAAAPARDRGRGRKTSFPLLPSAPSAVGAAALVIAAAGAVTVSDSDQVAAAGPTKMYTPASSFTGTSAVTSSLELDERTQAVSRDSQREALEDASDDDLQAAVEKQAEQRNAALAELAESAERYAGVIAANAWQLPLTNYRISAHFGSSSSLWASTHTGLDFAAPYGTPIVSVANGVVRSTEYDGSYGNKIVVALEDGTEIWYAHLASFTVSPGEEVRGGEQIGTVGSTGNSTGPHLHLEVRPGAGDAVDPYAAFLAHGLTP